MAYLKEALHVAFHNETFMNEWWIWYKSGGKNMGLRGLGSLREWVVKGKGRALSLKYIKYPSN
jgi:hypothetical protein